jgi:aryl-alcohol dehydrogenase-like predicted oxidoreductase
MFPTLKHFGVGIIPWSPLAKGLLTRPYKGDTTTKRDDSEYLDGPGTLEIVKRSAFQSRSGKQCFMWIRLGSKRYPRSVA